MTKTVAKKAVAKKTVKKAVKKDIKTVAKKSKPDSLQFDTVGQAIKVSTMPKLPNTDTTVRYIYVTGREKRRVTVAYVFDDANKVIKLSTAECVAQDNFVKKIGRGIATARLNNDFHTIVVPYEVIGESYKEITDFVTSNIKRITNYHNGNTTAIVQVSELIKSLMGKTQ